jgi:hypothetical protein
MVDTYQDLAYQFFLKKPQNYKEERKNFQKTARE